MYKVLKKMELTKVQNDQDKKAGWTWAGLRDDWAQSERDPEELGGW